MPFVWDASVTLAWLLPNDANSERAASLKAHLRRGYPIVPQIFHYEVLQTFVRLERQRRGSSPVLDGQVEELEALSVTFDAETFANLLPRIVPLARQHRLSVFDASYLELAIRLALPLATFDAALVRAAAAAQVTILT